MRAVARLQAAAAAELGECTAQQRAQPSSWTAPVAQHWCQSPGGQTAGFNAALSLRWGLQLDAVVWRVLASVLRPLGEFFLSVFGSNPWRADRWKELPRTTRVRESQELTSASGASIGPACGLI